MHFDGSRDFVLGLPWDSFVNTVADAVAKTGRQHGLRRYCLIVVVVLRLLTRGAASTRSFVTRLCGEKVVAHNVLIRGSRKLGTRVTRFQG